MSVLALRHRSMSEAIIAVNQGLTLPLEAGTVIVIPVEAQNTTALAPLYAVQVDETDISIKELADLLGVELADMMALNYQDATCRNFQGWLILPVTE